MAIDHSREAELLSYALELAATCSAHFHGLESGMIQDILAGEYVLPNINLHEYRDDITMFRQESPSDMPINLLVGMEVQQVTPALVEIAFAEIAHRSNWDIVMAKHMDTNKVIANIYRDESGSNDRAGQD